MAARNLAYRISVEGKEGALAAQREIGDSAEANWGRASRAAERAAQNAATAVERARRAAAVAAQAQPSPVAQNINRIVGIGDETKSARASAAAFAEALEEDERAARRLKAAIDPLWAAQHRLATETAEADRLLARGAISKGEHAAQLARLQRQYAQTEQAVRRMGNAHGFAAHEVSNLVAQANDVVVSLGSGQAPLTVLLQQGAQIGQQLGTRPGGVGAGLRDLVGLVPRTAFVFGGLALAIGVVIKAGLDLNEGQRLLAATSAGLGRTAGLTARQLEDQAQAAARSGEVSAAAAREQAAAFAGTGKIGAAVIGDLIQLQRDYAVATGRDSKAATEALAKSFADPIAGATELNRELGFLNATQLARIEQLVREGDRTAAQKLLSEQLKATTAGLATTYGGLGEQVRQAGVYFAFLYEKAGEFQRLAQAPVSAGFVQRAVKEAERLSEARGALARINQASAAGRDVRQQLFPDGRAALQAQEETLRRGFRAQLAGGELAEASRTRDALLAVARARQTYLDPAEKAHQLAVKEAQLAAAQDPKVKARLAGERERIALAGQVITQAEVETKVTDAQTLASARASNASGARTASLAREALSMDASAAAALKAADAYLVSESAGRLEEARRKAITEATRKGVDVEARARREVALASAEAALGAAKEAAALATRADAQRRVNDAVAAGLIRPELAQQALQIAEATAQADVAQGEAKTRLVAALNRQAQALRSLNAEEARGGLLRDARASEDRIAALRLEAQYAGDLTGARERLLAVLRVEQSADYRSATDERAKATARQLAADEAEAQRAVRKAEFLASTRQAQADDLELARAELALVGRSASEQDRILSRLRLIQQLRAQGLDLASDEVRVILAQADALDEVADRIRVANDNWQVFQGLGERTIDTILDPQNWDDWGDVGKSVLLDLSRTMLTLFAVNPLKNWLLGMDLPTGQGGVAGGGLLGAIFGGVQSRGGASGIVEGEWDWRRQGYPDLAAWMKRGGASPWGDIFSGEPDWSGGGRDSTLWNDADPFDFKLSLGDDPLGLGDWLQTDGEAFTLGLSDVFADNTRGGLVAALTRAFASFSVSGGGGGGGGGFFSKLLNLGVKALGSSFGGGGGFDPSAFFTNNPGVGGFDFTLPTYATGVDNFQGGLAKVHRDEVLSWLPKGTNVFTAAESRRMFGGLGRQAGVQLGGVHITLDARGAGPREVDRLQARLNELEMSLPSRILSTVNDGLARGRVASGAAA